MVFIFLSVLIVVLFIIRSLALTARLAVGEFKCREPSLDDLPPTSNESDMDTGFARLSNILSISVGFIHIPEHIYLLVYLYKFLGIYISWNENYKTALQIQMKEYVFAKKRSFFFIIVLLFFVIVAITIPPLCIRLTYSSETTMNVRCSQMLLVVTRSLTHFYHAASFITNVVVVLVRSLMVFFTVMIGVMWRRVKPTEDLVLNQWPDKSTTTCTPGERSIELDELQSRPPSSAYEPPTTNTQDDTLDQCKDVCCNYAKYLIEYTAIKEKVTPIYKIFRSFFVLQWIVHLFGLFFHIVNLVRPWIRRGQVVDANKLIVTHQIYQAHFIAFHGLALVISHICALKMNSYLRRYIRETQEKQLEEARRKSTMQYGLTQLFLIKFESVSKSNFTPRIPGTGLGIAVDSPGFVLSVVITVFALIGTLVNF